MFGTVDADQFLRGIDTDFKPLRFKQVRQQAKGEFFFDLNHPEEPGNPFSVYVQWEEASRILSLLVDSVTYIPIHSRYGWSLKEINDNINDFGCRCISKVSVVEPQSVDGFLNLHFTWEIRFPDFDPVEVGRLKTLQWLVQEHIIRLSLESEHVERRLYEKFLRTPAQ